MTLNEEGLFMTLEIDNLRKRFGRTQALDGMSFTVERGDVFGFVGSNGAGKTTTMRIMLGVLSTDSGEVRLDGHPLDFDARHGFGYMPEERGLYPKLKVGEQLVYLGELQGMSKADATASMEYWTDRLGVSARRGDAVEALSLGNQQRVQLAAALIHDPQVLVLDEPFSGLDPLAVEDMSSVLREKADAGATVIFSSHQLDLVERLCNRVAIASLGKIVASGTLDELRTTDVPFVDVVSGAGESAARAALLPLGVEVTDAGGALRVALKGGVSDQDVLRALLGAGPVESFTPYRPHLTELFSHLVTVPPPAPPKPQKKKKGLAALFGGRK
ncbi:ABC-2 type transport system ATP-binding protein [Arcanobacterium wilhelmae]|uniref:ABC-2 type transport system ATP-binding protein n=1 Tax=Arcanobacterium wilhelmae TaxID=1803177 RepID=A0ABT9NBX4_9ACTO|nr:ATP-binding cassette domain-containing protein [Arcanobacterium wilhelmae]MDP9801214.1 ABC-2 type transport system ATP-binding protein [Arcanobacterium wilhelmae]WFN90564.1 ATP-binding cassette domain-containing protein [Arcanobacterium wilhelmae]